MSAVSGANDTPISLSDGALEITETFAMSSLLHSGRMLPCSHGELGIHLTCVCLVIAESTEGKGQGHVNSDITTGMNVNGANIPSKAWR